MPKRILPGLMLAAMALVALTFHAVAQDETDDLPAIDPDTSIEQQPLPEVKTETPRVENPVAEFTGVDKITGRIINFDVYINETVQFGALQVTPRICYSRPGAEEPKTDSFVEVDEITLDRKIRRIFTGWMFAESPGLNAVEHAVYDVWLKSCKPTSDVPAPDKQVSGKPSDAKPVDAKPAASE